MYNASKDETIKHSKYYSLLKYGRKMFQEQYIVRLALYLFLFYFMLNIKRDFVQSRIFMLNLYLYSLFILYIMQT